MTTGIKAKPRNTDDTQVALAAFLLALAALIEKATEMLEVIIEQEKD